MDQKAFREFLVLSEMFMSQASLSRHIIKLENELGLPLFYRTSRKIKISPYGVMLLPYAQRILELENCCTESINQLKRQKNQLIVIGVFSTMAYYDITKLIAEFKKKYPKIEISVHESTPPLLIKDLANDICDFVFIQNSEISNSSDFCCIPFAKDQLVALVSKNHPFAGKNTISLNELKNEDFALLPEGSTAYKLSVAACHQAGFEPHQVFFGTKGRGIFDLVSHDLCVALMTGKPAKAMKTDSTVLLNIAPPITCDISLAYNKKELCPLTRNFLKFCKEWLISTNA